MENPNETHLNIIDVQNNPTPSKSIHPESSPLTDSQRHMNAETDSDKNEPKKRCREERVPEFDSNKKPKLAIALDMPNTSSSSSNVNLNIGEVAELFLKIIEGDYIMQEHYAITSDTDKSPKEALSDNMQTPYKIAASIELSSAEILTIEAINIEDFYQTTAKTLLKNLHSVIPLVEYLISKNYDWKQTGKFNETIMHYLVTLPNIMLALDKFDIDNQRDLLQTNFDREFNNPLLILAKLYAKNLNDLFYKNLKACFKVIFDFNNDCVTYVHISLDSSSNSNDSSTENNLSAFDIVYERIDSVLMQEQTTHIVENYLEILAMMCVHTQDDEDYLLIQIEDTFKKYTLKDLYQEKFDSYCKYYEQKNRALSNEEDEKHGQERKIDENHKANSNTNSFFNSSLLEESAVTNEQDVQSDFSSNENNITHKFL